MTNIITTSFCESFLDNLMLFIDEHYLKPGRDLNRLAIVFGGKRPALFLKRSLAQKIKHGFFPPRFFTIDEFIKYTIKKQESFRALIDLDQCYLIYNLARDVCPHILQGRESFAQFLGWTREILSFIDNLDLENVPQEALKRIESNARIGYAVPEDINRLLESVVALREAYHAYCQREMMYPRGYQYRRAAEVIEAVEFDEFDRILFCNFFYFHQAEETVVKSLCKRKQAVLFVQGDERKWPVLQRMSRSFSCPIQEGDIPRTPQFNLKLYSGFDVHSQVCLVREILKGIKKKDHRKTVIVLPNPHHIIPLLSEVTSLVKEFNISLGYPLKRSSMYSLFTFVFKAQLSRRDGGYYTPDYLKVLRHPLIKNLDIIGGAPVTRVLIHKIEEILTGHEKTSLSGSLFVKPEDILELDDLYLLTAETYKRMGSDVNRRDLKRILEKINTLVFHDWEGIKSFDDFAGVLDSFLNGLIQKSFLSRYPFNAKIAAKILDIKDEIKNGSFCREIFPGEDIFKIFDAKIEREFVAFTGSPLKGLQILGLFETRSLNFENVIVLDVNEGILPRLNIYEPLIPREVMISLNLDRLEQEEEIQRYQFMRLISSARNVHLVYQENREKEKSRFVEELIWEEEKKAGHLNAVDIMRPSFSVHGSPAKQTIKKTPEMMTFLRNYSYSASSLNTYLRSPLEFYYNHVLGLREKEDLLDEPENRDVGIFVHAVLEEGFKRFVGAKPVIGTEFRQYFQKVVDQRFAETFEKNKRSDAFLLKSVIDTRLNRFLDQEAGSPERRVQEILFIEKRFEDKMALTCGEFRFVYRVDRVDKMEDGTVMIIDYKTGISDPMPGAVEQIATMDLSRQTIAENVRSFQIPLYFCYLDKYFQDQPINAAFYNLRTLEVDKWIDKKRPFDPQRMKSAFLRSLDYIMSEILNPEVNFYDSE